MLSRKYHGTQRLAFKSEFYNELNSSPTKADQHNSSPEFWLRLGTFNLTEKFTNSARPGADDYVGLNSGNGKYNKARGPRTFLDVCTGLPAYNDPVTVTFWNKITRFRE